MNRNEALTTLLALAAMVSIDAMADAAVTAAPTRPPQQTQQTQQTQQPEQPKPSQPSKPPASPAAKKLEMARLAEDSERDFERAITLYRELGNDAAAPAELRAQAWLRCGQCLKQLGRADEAKSAFEGAAALSGDAAERARRILAGTEEDPTRLKQRIWDAIGALERMSIPNAGFDFESPPLSNLLWIGEPAVPELSQWLLEHTDEPELVSRLTIVLIAIGGEEAAKTLRTVAASDDSFLKRTVLRSTGGRGTNDEPVRTALAAFFHDSDPRIVSEAMQHLDDNLKFDELQPLLHVADSAMRYRALRAATRCSLRLTHQLCYPDAMLDDLERALADPSSEVRTAACDALREGAILGSDRGRRVYLAALADDALFTNGASDGWVGAAFKGDFQCFAPPLPAALLAAAAPHMGGFRWSLGPNQNPAAGRSSRAGTFESLVSRNYQDDHHALTQAWSVSDHPELWKLLKAGALDAIVGYAEHFARPEDAVAIAEALTDHATLSVLGNWFKLNVPKLAPPAQQRVIAALAQMVHSLDEQIPRLVNPREHDSSRSEILKTLSTFGIVEADRELLHAITVTPGNYKGLARTLIERESPPAPEVLAELLVLSAGSKDNNDKMEGERSRVLQLLAATRSPLLLERLPRAYELGLEGRQMQGNNGNIATYCGIHWALLDADSNGEIKFEPRFSDDAIVKSFEACAQRQLVRFWFDVSQLLRWLERSAPPDGLRRRLEQVVGRYIADCPDAEARKRVIHSYLGSKGAGWREFAVAHFNDPELAKWIGEYLPDVPMELVEPILGRLDDWDGDARDNMPFKFGTATDPAVREKLFTLLHHPAPAIRRNTIEQLADKFPDRFVDALLPLAKDEDLRVRLNVCTAFGTAFDRRTIPALVDCLRDPQAMVRDAARKSLEQLQFYFDQKGRWSRLLDGAGLEANNAAEALLKQAGAGQPKPSRLAAIQSLGTLGVAETLPFLIQLMAESDAEIATAAKAALDRINARAASKEEPKNGGNGNR